LHDEVGQLLTALKFDLEAVRQAMRVGTASANGRAQERTIRALETTDELFVRLRRVVRALRPPVLEELGLKAALEALVSDTKSRSDLVCAVSIEGEAVDSVEAATIEAALYRMTQELVTNVVRHAQAMTLTVILDVDARQWKLTVQDDGLGFDPKHESISGMGIRGIRERAEILGGHVDVSSQPGAGTTVMVCIPAPAAGILNEGMNDM
jgi:signal transduction histidine kinase